MKSSENRHAQGIACPLALSAGSNVVRVTALICTALLVAACGSDPLPLSAQAGSTIAVPVSGERTQSAQIGYGGELLRSADIYDDQRGELVFKLTAGSDTYTLSTRIVTRLAPDPASQVAIDNAVADPFAPSLGLAQVVALVDIPTDTPSGAYTMTVERCRRTTVNGTCQTLGPLIYSRPFTILPGTGTPNPTTGFVASFTQDTTNALLGLYPYPKINVNFPTPLPAAAHVVVNYPKTKISVKSVFEDQHQGRGSIVAWQDDPVAGRVTIDFVDPEASVGALAIAFELIDPFGAGRAANADFSIASAQLYDANGLVITPSVNVNVNGIR